VKALIVSGGVLPGKNELKRLRRDADLLIGVDGAAETLLACKIVPDVLIGDFDTADPKSVQALEVAGAHVIRLDTRKNQTDTQAAVDHALGAGAAEITMIGAVGTRLDHTLANVQMLLRAAKRNAAMRLVDAHNEAFAATGETTLHGVPGQTVSILPMDGDISVSSDGLEYPLKRLSLPHGSSRGISNVMTEQIAHIHISGGYALIIKSDASE